MRRKMNLRFKLFKRAVSTKDQEIYATSKIRNAMAQYFKDKLAEVLKLIVEATNPVRLC